MLFRSRVWSWAAARFGTADAFFRQAFVWNWCPLAFMAESGANLTPDKLPRTGRGAAGRRRTIAAGREQGGRRHEQDQRS